MHYNTSTHFFLSCLWSIEGDNLETGVPSLVALPPELVYRYMEDLHWDETSGIAKTAPIVKCIKGYLSLNYRVSLVA